MARRFMFVCIGILALALAYHLGSTVATAQSGSVVTGFTAAPGAPGESAGAFYVLTANGDVFGRYMAPGSGSHAMAYFGNFWAGTGPTPVQTTTFGTIKAHYR